MVHWRQQEHTYLLIENAFCLLLIPLAIIFCLILRAFKAVALHGENLKSDQPGSECQLCHFPAWWPSAHGDVATSVPQSCHEHHREQCTDGLGLAPGASRRPGPQQWHHDQENIVDDRVCWFSYQNSWFSRKATQENTMFQGKELRLSRGLGRGSSGGPPECWVGPA